MAEAEYKILVRRLKYDCRDDEEDIQEALNDAAEELSADVTAHLGNGWSLHGSLSVGTTGMNGNEGGTTFTQALFKPSGTTPGGAKPVVTKRQRE
jgi:hypothetical protein